MLRLAPGVAVVHPVAKPSLHVLPPDIVAAQLPCNSPAGSGDGRGHLYLQVAPAPEYDPRVHVSSPPAVSVAFVLHASWQVVPDAMAEAAPLGQFPLVMALPDVGR